MNEKLSLYFENLKGFKAELSYLRQIILSTGLVEEIKWKQPCYTMAGKNVILLGEFKSRCIISFLQGNLLKDELKILHKIGENTVGGRIIPFTKLEEVTNIENEIKAYIFEAIEISKLKNSVKEKAQKLDFPAELSSKFKLNQDFKTAFENLTPGRQRGYLLHFTGSKNSVTRSARIENKVDRIIKGFGINDCTCGLSKRKPNCDGSHKNA